MKNRQTIVLHDKEKIVGKVENFHSFFSLLSLPFFETFLNFLIAVLTSMSENYSAILLVCMPKMIRNIMTCIVVRHHTTALANTMEDENLLSEFNIRCIWCVVLDATATQKLLSYLENEIEI